MARAYQSGTALVGAIFGTGTNGAYVEDLVKVKKMANSTANRNSQHMIINTEWGAFDNAVSLFRLPKNFICSYEVSQPTQKRYLYRLLILSIFINYFRTMRSNILSVRFYPSPNTTTSLIESPLTPASRPLKK